MAAKKPAGAKRFVNNSNFLLLALLMVAILFLLIAFGPFSANNLGLLSKKQQNQESQASYLPPEGGSSSSKAPPCTGRRKVGNYAFVNYRYGDVNSDGYVDSVDSLLILRAVSRLTISTPLKMEDFWERADVSGKVGTMSSSGEVTSDDARLVLRYGASLEKTFPACGGHTGIFDFDNP